MSRDKLADAEYFTLKIKEQEGYIAEDHQNIRSNMKTRGPDASGMAWRLVNDQLIIASMAYSRGDPVDDVQKWVILALEDLKYQHELYDKYPKQLRGDWSYIEAFRLLFFAVLFCPKSSQAQRAVYEAEFFNWRDPILLAFIAYINGEPINQQFNIEDLDFAGEFGDLWLAISYNGDARIPPLKRYLNNWYERNLNGGGMPGIGAHEKMIRYEGYWCWEAAAVAVMMDIDDTSFRDHEHYPKDLADWARYQKANTSRPQYKGLFSSTILPISGWVSSKIRCLRF